MPYLADVSPDLVKVLKWVCFLAPLLLCCCLFALVGLRRSRDGTQRISDDDWLWLAHTEVSRVCVIVGQRTRPRYFFPSHGY